MGFNIQLCKHFTYFFKPVYNFGIMRICNKYSCIWMLLAKLKRLKNLSGNVRVELGAVEFVCFVRVIRCFALAFY